MHTHHSQPLDRFDEMNGVASVCFRMDSETRDLCETDLGGLGPVERAMMPRISRLRDLFVLNCESFHEGCFKPSREKISRDLSFNGAFIIESIHGDIPRRIYKPLSAIDAARTEFVSILANLFGIETPLALRTQICVGGQVAGSGISSIYIENSREARNFRYETAPAAVLNYLVRTRWFNELIGNLECWWGQFLIVPADENAYSVVMVDLDGAFSSVSCDFLKHALETHYDRPGIRLEDCGWLDCEYRFTSPVGWSPCHYDSQYSFYGPLWRAYLSGVIRLDIDRIIQDTAATLRHGDGILKWVIDRFLSASRKYHKGLWTLVPAARNPKVESEVFCAEFLARFRRSVPEFEHFLRTMESARADVLAPMHQFYRDLSNRPY